MPTIEYKDGTIFTIEKNVGRKPSLKLRFWFFKDTMQIGDWKQCSCKINVLWIYPFDTNSLKSMFYKLKKEANHFESESVSRSS